MYTNTGARGWQINLEGKVGGWNLNSLLHASNPETCQIKAELLKIILF